MFHADGSTSGHEFLDSHPFAVSGLVFHWMSDTELTVSYTDNKRKLRTEHWTISDDQFNLH